MKRLVVLMALLVFAGMLWAQAPAAPTFTMGLTLDYMWAQDFVGPDYSDRPILELKFNWKADDFTTAYVELEEGPMSSQGDTRTATAATYTVVGAGADGDPTTSADNDLVTVTVPNVTATGGLQGGFRNVYSTNADAGYNVAIHGLDKAYFTTDVGKALKTPVPVVVMYGYNEWNGKDGIKVTKSEFEDFLGEADIRNWGAQIEVTPSPAVTLRSNWAWNPGADGLAEGQFLVNAYGTVAPVTYEVTYFTHGMSPDLGWIEGGLKFAQDMSADLNVAAMFSFEYDLAGGEDYAEALGLPTGSSVGIPAYNWAGAEDAAYMIQAGLQVMFQKMAAFGVSYRGAEELLDGAVQLQGYFTPKAGDPLEAFVQIGLGLNGDVFEEMFDSAEVALRYTMGKVQWYLGLFWSPELGRAIAKEWADFDLFGVSANGSLETTAVFMRGKLAL